jgi:hypothetical protein
LEQEKYYLGASLNISNRDSMGIPIWVKQYPPISDRKILLENADSFDEDKYVKQYMTRYGIENVRGGSYVQLTLPQWQLLSLRKEIWGATGRCFKCGEDRWHDHVCFNVLVYKCNECNKRISSAGTILAPALYKPKPEVLTVDTYLLGLFMGLFTLILVLNVSASLVKGVLQLIF